MQSPNLHTDPRIRDTRVPSAWRPSFGVLKQPITTVASAGGWAFHVSLMTPSLTPHKPVPPTENVQKHGAKGPTLK